MRKILLILTLIITSYSYSQNVGESKTEVPMYITNGVIEIPAKLNDVLSIKFIVDTGASESSIPLFVINTLIRTDTVLKTDQLESRDYILADGSVSTARRIRINTVQIGDTIVNDVSFSISDGIGSPLLIGQNILRNFKTVQFDYTTNTLILIK